MGSRIEYIDAMRGLAMTMVVICHFFTWGFNYDNVLYVHVNNVLQIPLFFLVGGFFAPLMLKKPFIKAIQDRFGRLVVPAILMLGLFCWVFDLDYVNALFHRYNYGYWFTFVMFGYTIIYLFISIIFKLSRLSDKTSDCLHLLVGLLITYIALATDGLSNKWPVFELFSTTEYDNYFFYALGSVFFTNRHYVLNALDNKNLIGGYFALCYWANFSS